MYFFIIIVSHENDIVIDHLGNKALSNDVIEKRKSFSFSKDGVKGLVKRESILCDKGNKKSIAWKLIFSQDLCVTYESM